MKKSILFLASFMILVFSVGSACAKTTNNTSLTSAIKMYKAGNYSQSYNICKNIVSKDPSNAVAYYYLAMSSVQAGKKEEAIEYYSKVISLSTNRQLTRYANKGKACIEEPDRCGEEEESEEDSFVRSGFRDGFSKEARSEFEKKKIENLMREINRNGEVAPSKFKEYKDFSGAAPTNDEIVSALRVIQRAGLGNVIGGGYGSDLSFLNSSNSDANLLNMFAGNDMSKLSPQVIQAMLTNQMTAGF